ncbi:hypothetical protein DCO49_06800 [Stenotrophomonas sp. SPM]|uniref:hypothetical protein n=1 Tax=Stenotrophomonas sp. SPM TaxID=2170735 RepID=UPI000DE5E51B|nr:hypothetical protein [Stenotrophomonas sp. SPM]PWB27718.1 hypothetical protein DCO49_06800 [Stenotrophomonas sp. SPM]
MSTGNANAWASTTATVLVGGGLLAFLLSLTSGTIRGNTLILLALVVAYIAIADAAIDLVKAYDTTPRKSLDVIKVVYRVLSAGCAAAVVVSQELSKVPGA